MGSWRSPKTCKIVIWRGLNEAAEREKVPNVGFRTTASLKPFILPYYLSNFKVTRSLYFEQVYE